MATRSNLKNALRLAALMLQVGWSSGLGAEQEKRIPSINIRATEAARTLNLFSGTEGYVSADESTNSILIPKDPPELAASLEELIGHLDPQRHACNYGQAVVQLLRADAEEVANIIQKIVESGEFESESSDVHVHPITRTNSVLVIARPAETELLENLIHSLDVPPKTVYFSAALLRVRAGELGQLSKVDEIEIGGGTVRLTDHHLPGSGGAIIRLPSTDADKTWAGVGAFLNVYVEALEQSENCEVLSRPFVFVVDGKTADIRFDQPVALPQTIRPDPQESTPSAEEYSDWERTRSMRLTPHIHSENELSVSIQLDRESKLETLEFSTRMNHRDLIILSTAPSSPGEEPGFGTPVSERIEFFQTGDKNVHEHVLVLQPFIIEPSDESKEPEVDPDLFPDLRSAATSFESWVAANLPDGPHSFEADCDADGIANGIEYIFGDREIVSPAAGQLIAPPEPIPSDVTLSLEFSEDLQNWMGILRFEFGKLVRQLDGVRIEEGIVSDGREPPSFAGARYYRYRASQ